ncbi:MAG: hypothetical protein JOZ08_10850 [Verrucomicrobia bacterium]|nr:hypothetical protein [Verrucomicrobiota bacterium]
MKPILPLVLLLPIISLAQPAAAASTTPLFDSNGTAVIGGDPNPYPYNANIPIGTSSTETFYISLGTGNQSGTPWGGGNLVTSLNLSLWAYSATGSAVPVTVGLYTGTDTGTALSNLAALSGVSGPLTENINNTTGGNYTNAASLFSFSVTGGSQTTDPIGANTDLVIGITVQAGSPLDLAIGAPLGGSPSPTYTFSNAFTGSTGLDPNTYLYSGGNGVLTGGLLQQNTNLLPFVDLTASITPLPELPPVTYLLLSVPLFVGVLLLRRRAQA